MEVAPAVEKAVRLLGTRGCCGDRLPHHGCLAVFCSMLPPPPPSLVARLRMTEHICPLIVCQIEPKTGAKKAVTFPGTPCHSSHNIVTFMTCLMPQPPCVEPKSTLPASSRFAAEFMTRAQLCRLQHPHPPHTPNGRLLEGLLRVAAKNTKNVWPVAGRSPPPRRLTQNFPQIPTTIGSKSHPLQPPP